jgi:hypothetical protein
VATGIPMADWRKEPIETLVTAVEILNARNGAAPVQVVDEEVTSAAELEGW